MFIINASEEDKSKWYCCTNLLGDYLQKHAHPMIYRDKSKQYFVKTFLLSKELGELPLYLRFALVMGW